MRQIKNKNFIIVDDELGIFAKNITKILSLHGIFGETAENYVQALEKMTKTKFGFAIIDLNLGGNQPNGVELIQKIRETDNDMVIHVLTGYGYEKEPMAIAAGADKFLVKPLDIKEHILKPYKEMNG
jgi:ActR/RegA family two-component response regulator